MTKKIILLIMAAAMTFLLVACGNTQKLNTLVNLENVSSITVGCYPPDETIALTGAQAKEVINMLNGMSVGERDDSYHELNGQWVEFTITKEDGSVISVAESGYCVVVDGVGYKGSSKDCEKLNDFANNLLSR